MMAEWLIPKEHPMAGCVILGILFMFSMQQVCISPISDRPVIFYRYIAAVYCLNAWILSCLLLSHYENPDDDAVVAGCKIFIGWVIIWGTFSLCGLGIRSVEAAYKSHTDTSKATPSWFRILTKTLGGMNIISIIVWWALAYLFGNDKFIDIHYLFMDSIIIILCVGVFIALLSVVLGLNEIISLAEKALLHIKDENNKKLIKKVFLLKPLILSENK